MERKVELGRKEEKVSGTGWMGEKKRSRKQNNHTRWRGRKETDRKTGLEETRSRSR